MGSLAKRKLLLDKDTQTIVKGWLLCGITNSRITAFMASVSAFQMESGFQYPLPSLSL